MYKLLKPTKSMAVAETPVLGSELAEYQPCANKLPPKRLSPKPSKRRAHWYKLNITLCFGIIVGTVAYAAAGFRRFRYATSDDPFDNQCDLRTSQGIVERNFIIDIRFGGSFTFAQAKMIDVAWDMLVGQGGRFLHGWVLYRYVAAATLTHMMEYATVPYRFYTNLTFSTVTWEALIALAKALRSLPGSRVKWSALWLIFAVIYTLAYPTIWSAATGYLKPTTTVYRVPDDSLVSLDSESLSVCWSVTNDSRFTNQTGGHIELGPRLDLWMSNPTWSLANYPPEAWVDNITTLRTSTINQIAPPEFLDLYHCKCELKLLHRIFPSPLIHSCAACLTSL